MPITERASQESVTQKENQALTQTELAEIVVKIARSSEWLARVRLGADVRWYERLHCGSDHDVWVISWMPGQSTGFHDHGNSSGAFTVTTGTLEELLPEGSVSQVERGQVRHFDSEYAHDVRNASTAPAISIHAYSPPLREMNALEWDGEELIPRYRSSGPTPVNDNSWNREWRAEEPTTSTGIERVLAAARAKLRRVTPEEAFAAADGKTAILVDIRPESQRAREGQIPGAFIVERNVLEWRFDPDSSARLPIASEPDLRIILFCSEGYASSLAAVDLQEIGLWRATDMAGGFRAWRESGLPTEATQ